MTLYTVAALCFILLDFLCIIAVLFFERKNPSSTIAWVMVLLFLPVVGILAYFSLGSGFRVNKTKRYTMKAATDRLDLDYLVKKLSLGDRYFFLQQHKDLARLLSYLHNSGDGVYTGNNTVQTYTEGAGAFADMLADLRAAEDHIHMLSYLFRPDALGKEILAILTEKAREGVRVCLMYDSVGNLLASSRCFRELTEAGGRVRAFSPLVLNLNTEARLNYRNHRKITVIDGKVAYVGGMNVGEEYLGRHKTLTPWRDTHLRITGRAVWFLHERFLLDWGFVSGEDLQALEFRRFFPENPGSDGHIGIQIVSSGPDTDKKAIKGGLMEMLYCARKNIYIQTPYFTPDETFLEAMCSAAQADMDVRLMLPAFGDHALVHLASLNFGRRVIEAGVRVFLYRGFLHAKTVTIDGQVASIGTTNIGSRSFALNFEVNAFIYDAEYTRHHEQIFYEDMAHCTELTLDWFKEQPVYKRAFISATRVLAPLM